MATPYSLTTTKAVPQPSTTTTETVGRVRKPKPISKQKKPRSASRREDEIRFDTGPKQPKTRPARVRQQRETSSRSNLNESYWDPEYPDYPPPSFLEATTPISLEPPPSARPPSPALPPLPVESQTASDTLSDTSSIELIEPLDPSVTQWDEDRDQGLPLEVRVRREFHRMCTGQSTPDLVPRPFVAPLATSPEAGPSTPPRGVLDDRHSFESSSPTTSTKSSARHHLSPLRMFKPFAGLGSPPSSPRSSSPPMNSPSGSSFASKSTVTLGRSGSISAASTKTSSASLHTSERRRFFPNPKGKEREQPETVDLLDMGETIDTWEMVNDDASTSVEAEGSTIRAKRSAEGRPLPEKVRPGQPPAEPDNVSTPLSVAPASSYPADSKSSPARKRPPPPPPPKRTAPPPLHTGSLNRCSSEPTPISPTTTVSARKRPPPPPPSSRKGKEEEDRSMNAEITASAPSWGINVGFAAALREIQQHPQPVEAPQQEHVRAPPAHVASPLSTQSPVTMLTIDIPPPSPAHYHGRPLPQPPGSMSPIYVPSPFVGVTASSVPRLVEPSMAEASSSSVNLVGATVRPTSPPQLSQFTDLDLLVSRLNDETTTAGGAAYDTLLLLSEFAGPASSSVPSSTGAATPLLGRVEIQRRRVTKDGRVKLKLSLFDISVDKCGICFCQFRSEDKAALGESCKHAFHERCLMQWLVRMPTCPMCRVPLNLER